MKRSARIESTTVKRAKPLVGDEAADEILEEQDPYCASDDSDKDKDFVPEECETTSMSSSSQSSVFPEDESYSSASTSRVNANSQSEKFKNLFAYLHNNLNQKYAECKLCKLQGKNVQLKMKQSNTSGLKKHLRARHKKEFSQLYPADNTHGRGINAAASTSAIKQQTISNMFRSSQHQFGSACAPISQPEFDELVVEWIAVKYLPFNFFEDDFSQKLFGYLNKQLVYPKRTSLKIKAMDRFNKMQESVIRIMNANSSKVSFTIDGWTSVANKSFYGITAHYVDDNYTLQSLVIDFVPSHGHHTGRDIAQFFYSTLKKYNIVEKLQGITVDNAASNTRFMHELSQIMADDVNVKFDPVDQHFRCFAHILNLAVQDILKLIRDEPKNDYDDYGEDGGSESDQEEDAGEKQKPLSKLRTLFLKIKRSEQWQNKFKSCCDVTNIKCLATNVDVSTRWNSTNDMLAVAIKLKPALNALCENNAELSSLKIREDDWAIFSQIQKILKYFKSLSVLLSAEEYVTLPLVVIGFNMLLDKLEEEIFALDSKENRTSVDEMILLAFQAARNKLIKHYTKANWIYCVVLLLDPRHKKETFYLTDWGKELLNSSMQKFEEIYKNEYYAPEFKSNSTQTTEHSTREEDEDFDLCCLFEMKNQKSAESTWRNEIDAYFNSPRAPRDANILQWWNQNASTYPTLSKMARDYFSITATSVPAERLFSRAGLTIRKHRNRLSADSARCLLCINSWCNNKLYKSIKENE